MPAAVSFREVSATGFFDNFSFEVEAGKSALIVTSHEDENSFFLRLVTGLSRPAQGSVNILGQQLEELTPAQLYQSRQQIGIVPSNGGLVSNLKLWENIFLPLLYTKGNISEEVEEFAIGNLKKLGYSGNIMALPAHLTIHEKRIAAFIRAIICKPLIMVYSNCFADMAAQARKRFTSAAAEFHTESKGRTSIYLATSAEAARELPVDIIIKAHESPEIITGSI